MFTQIFLLKVLDRKWLAIFDRDPSVISWRPFTDLLGVSGFPGIRDRSRAEERLLVSIHGAADVALPYGSASVPFSSRRPLASQLCVMLAIPTLGERGCGRTLGGIRVLVRFLVVPSPYHRKVGHLERVSLLAAALQRACHTVTHVEVARRDVRRQVQL